jgi:murein L,D-transpeptidase YafK
MRRRDLFVGSAFALSGCAGGWPFRTAPAQPEVEPGSVTRLHILKGDRLLRLETADQVVLEYQIGLGFAPEGPKRVQGDGRTPEGLYRIDRRNPQSAYHLSLGVSYPSPEDQLRAWAGGHGPGGDIFLHGSPNGMDPEPAGDWTRGCIAVRNAEIEEIWNLVPNGCPILIEA